MYTKITNAKHGASAIDYVLQEQGHYKEKRNEYVTGVNLMLSGDVSITEQMEHSLNPIILKKLKVKFLFQRMEKHIQLQKTVRKQLCKQKTRLKVQ